MRDIDVRAALRIRLNAEHSGDTDTRVVEEMGIWAGAVRVDVAVINGELNGYELKSDSDNLERLPHQVQFYGKVFDRVTLVVGRKHAKKAATVIPKWWGLIEARESRGSVTLKPKRKGRINPNRDPNIIAQLLWKHEALEILASYGLARGWRSKSASDICKRLVAELTLDDLRFHVRRALKARDRLGQVVACDLNMSVQVETHPNTGISASSSGFRDGVDSIVRPTVRQTVPFRSQRDYLIGVPSELLVHGHSAWTFDLDPAQDEKLSGKAVLGVDGSKKVDVRRRSRRDAAVVTKVQTVGERATGDLLPQLQLLSFDAARTQNEPRESLWNGAPEKGHATPGASAVEIRKGIRHRDSKGRYVRNRST